MHHDGTTVRHYYTQNVRKYMHTVRGLLPRQAGEDEHVWFRSEIKSHSAQWTLAVNTDRDVFVSERRQFKPNTPFSPGVRHPLLSYQTHAIYLLIGWWLVCHLLLLLVVFILLDMTKTQQSIVCCSDCSDSVTGNGLHHKHRNTVWHKVVRPHYYTALFRALSPILYNPCSFPIHL